MFKVSCAIIAVVSFVGLAKATFRDDACGKAEVWFSGLYGRVQCDYTDRASQHYREENGVQYLWAYTNDQPHSANANGRNPRTEITLSDRHAYTKSDTAEFSGKVFVPTSTNAPFSFFQVKHDGTQGTRATSAMLNH